MKGLSRSVHQDGNSDVVLQVRQQRQHSHQRGGIWYKEAMATLVVYAVAFYFLNGPEDDRTTPFRHLQNVNGTGPPEKSVGEYILDFAVIILLICMSGLFSGLTLGLMSLDKIGLEIVIGGEPDSEDAKNAKKIQPIREHGNLLLCTLLLGNTLVNAALAVFLSSYTSGVVGTVISTMLIFFFGELLPQATCSRHALYIGARTVWLVKFFMAIFFIVVKPVSMILDCLLSEEIGSIYTSSQLGKLVDIHVQHEKLSEEQAKMMGGAIDYKEKVVKDVMTTRENIFMLSADAVLDFPTIANIFKSGYSRIPVFEGKQDNIVGLILTKDLIVIDPEEGTHVHSIIKFFGRPVHWLWPDTKLSEALKLFKSGRGHLALARNVVDDVEDRDPYYELCGLITLEDIIEEIIGDEIVDETDLYVQVEDDTTKVNRSGFDFTKLKLFNSKRFEKLSSNEADVVLAHLMMNVSYFSGISKIKLDEFLREMKLHDYVNGEALCKPGKNLSHYIVILKGRLSIQEGDDEPRIQGPWSSLGTNPLESKSSTVAFSAVVVSHTLSCLRFSKQDFLYLTGKSKYKVKEKAPPPAQLPED